VAFALLMATSGSYASQHRHQLGKGQEVSVDQEVDRSDGHCERLSGHSKRAGTEIGIKTGIRAEAREDGLQLSGNSQDDPRTPEAAAIPQNYMIFMTAGWCPGCKKMKPTIEKLQKQGYIIKVIDYDANKAMAKKLGVTTLPTAIIYVDDKEVTRHIGSETYKKHLKKPNPDEYDVW